MIASVLGLAIGRDPERPRVLVAEVDHRVVGIALWFRTYSTWTGVPGIHLEDLYVEPAQRGSGLGKALLASLARIAVDRGYQRVEWVVLDWNTPSIEFYKSLGARPMQEWSTYRLTGDAKYEAAFVPARNHASAASRLYLRIRSPERSRKTSAPTAIQTSFESVPIPTSSAAYSPSEKPSRSNSRRSSKPRRNTPSRRTPSVLFIRQWVARSGPMSWVRD